MGVIPVLPFIQEPAIRPNLGGPQHLLAGSQNDAHRFVVDHQRKARHWRTVTGCMSLRCNAITLPDSLAYNVPSYNELRFSTES